MSDRNVFIYWNGYDYKLILILRKLIYLHSKNGKGYTLHFLKPDNIKNYITSIPKFFFDLHPAHQADFIRINVVYKYGGIWLDSDTLVIDSLDYLFDFLDVKNGFFILENNQTICNGVFGSKKKTKLMRFWVDKCNKILNLKKQNIDWCEIGSVIIDGFYKKNNYLFENYHIFLGLDNLYPPSAMLLDSYDNYVHIEKTPHQPLLVLNQKVYKKLECLNEKKIFDGNMALNYFINKSFKNASRLIYFL